MKVAFRADASLQIGTGHVMRCLTLADALASRGAECVFLCREHPGHLLEFIRSKGHAVHALSSQPAGLLAGLTSDVKVHPSHSHWLGASQDQDAGTCAAILSKLRPDWVVVDHYALDAHWERAIKPYCEKLLVIDDLADRAHACDLLLDQTFARQPEDYSALVPVDCQLLCGSQYALLRPEFAALRPYSLQRRADPQLRRVLITLGGVDKDNVTSQVLVALRESPLPCDCTITVVMGRTAPWLAEVSRLAHCMPWPTEVLVGVSNMAQLMADSDLAIGAAGATSWERCCLGLPTIMLILADNQQQIAQVLEHAGAARTIAHVREIASDVPMQLRVLIEQAWLLGAMSESAADIVDGHGLKSVASLLEC